MAKLDLNHEKGNEAEHGSTPVEALSVGGNPYRGSRRTGIVVGSIMD